MIELYLWIVIPLVVMSIFGIYTMSYELKYSLEGIANNPNEEEAYLKFAKEEKMWIRIWTYILATAIFPFFMIPFVIVKYAPKAFVLIFKGLFRLLAGMVNGTNEMLVNYREAWK